MFLYVYTASLVVTTHGPGITLTSTMFRSETIGSPVPVSVIARNADAAMDAARGSLPFTATKADGEWWPALVSISSVPTGSE